jgi:hypothetical protein
VSNLPCEWLPHFELVQKITTDIVRMPFGKDDPVPRLEADISVDFSDDPGVRAEIRPPGNLIRLPIGLYLRSRMIALALAKNPSVRRIPEHFTGKTISQEQARPIVAAMRSFYPSLEALLSETKRRLEDIGNDEPEDGLRFTAFGSQAELVASFAVNFVATHELCHFWYGHFGAISASVETFREQAWSLKEVQADMGAGSSLADYIAVSLDYNAIPPRSLRSGARLYQLSHLAGLAMAITLDLLDTLHSDPELRGRKTGYEPFDVRFAISAFRFFRHLWCKVGFETSGSVLSGLVDGKTVYSHVTGRQHDREALIARVKDIFNSADDLVNFAELAIEQTPNTPDKEALVRHRLGQNQPKSSVYNHLFGRQNYVEAPATRIKGVFSWADYIAQFAELTVEQTATEEMSVRTERQRYRGNGLYLTDPNDDYRFPEAAERPDFSSDFWRKWIDPLEIIQPDLAQAMLGELRTVAARMGDELGKRVILWPTAWNEPQSGIIPEDPAFGSFRIAIGAGLMTRLPLILRCLFDRLDATPARRDLSDSACALLGERYEALVAASGNADLLRWWASRSFSDNESYELRRGWRYGLLFLLFRAGGRIHRGHFLGLEQAEFELDHENIALLRLGLHLDADLYALLNLVNYIRRSPDLETRNEIISEALLRVTNPGQDLRAAFFGVFALASCMQPIGSIVPGTRLAWVVKLLDGSNTRTDGSAMFQYFQSWTPTLLPKWDWSEFAAACFHDWDDRTGALRADMKKNLGLSSQPNPFISGAAFDVDNSASERCIAACVMAARYTDMFSVR